MQDRQEQELAKAKAKILDLTVLLARHVEDPDFEQKMELVKNILEKENPSNEIAIESIVPDMPEFSIEPNDEIFIENSIPEENQALSTEINIDISKTETPPKKERHQKTVAVQVCDSLRPRAPGVKSKINEEGEDVGSSQTPIKKRKLNKEKTKVIFSPQGTTMEVIYTTHAFFKKTSGNGFVVPENKDENKDENKENSL